MTKPAQAEKVRCQYCAAERPRVDARPAAISFAGGKQTVSAWHCKGTACARLDASREQAKIVCRGVGCDRRFERPARPQGRPQLYCDERCRKASHALLSRALKALARGKLPSTGMFSSYEKTLRQIDVEILEAEALQRSWLKPGRVSSMFGPTAVVEPLPGHETPPREMAKALARRILDLHARRDDVVRERAQANAESRAEANYQRFRGHRAEAKAADQEWRTEVLGADETGVS